MTEKVETAEEFANEMRNCVEVGMDGELLFDRELAVGQIEKRDSAIAAAAELRGKRAVLTELVELVERRSLTRGGAYEICLKHAMQDMSDKYQPTEGETPR